MAHRRLVGQPLLYAVSVFASLGVFLFGYDQGVMSGIITGPHFISFFGTPGPIAVGSMVAVLEVGAFITSVAAGRIGDIIGRKGTLFIGALVFTVGGAVQTFTTGFAVMVIGRFISGFGVGLLSTIVPIYQSEISPPNHRGALACAEFTGNIFGYAFSVWTDYFCSFIDSNYAWRIPLFIQCVIGAILAAGSLVMPESPRWLIDTDKDDEGLRILADLHGGDLDDPIARAEYREIKDRVMLDRESGDGRSYGMMWKKYKQRVLLAMSSQAFAQLNGINVISYYAPRVFEEAGWIGRQAILMTGINALIYLASTLPPWYLVDRWGRRPILLSGAVVMGLSLCATGYWLYLDLPATPNAVVVCVIIFNAAFGYSWGPLPWLYPPEIMPLSVRAKGVSISTATNWAFNTLVGEITPYLQEVITWRLYFMHGFFCGCSFILVYFLYPETKGVPLEEMDAVFGEG
ncbi:general substrate transporter [Mucidula mucida]|nr:general substrate transporter [Mucidula mucida]